MPLEIRMFAAAAPAGGAATIQVIREAGKAARSFKLTDYRYKTLRHTPRPAEREEILA